MTAKCRRRIVLPVSSLLIWALLGAGIGTISLGIWHLGVPRWFAFRSAIATDHDGLPELPLAHVGPWTVERTRTDVLGLSWVMSNAASFVLVSVGLLDLAWAGGFDAVPLLIGALWIAMWWTIRAFGQFALGRRPRDVAAFALFGVLAVLHVAVAVSAAA